MRPRPPRPRGLPLTPLPLVALALVAPLPLVTRDLVRVFIGTGGGKIGLIAAPLVPPRPLPRKPRVAAGLLFTVDIHSMKD